MDETRKLDWDGYSVTMYRSPNTGDMVFDIEVPEDFEDSVTVNLNDERLGLT